MGRRCLLSYLMLLMDDVESGRDVGEGDVAPAGLRQDEVAFTAQLNQSHDVQKTSRDLVTRSIYNECDRSAHLQRNGVREYSPHLKLGALVIIG